MDLETIFTLHEMSLSSPFEKFKIKEKILGFLPSRSPIINGATIVALRFLMQAILEQDKFKENKEKRDLNLLGCILIQNFIYFAISLKVH